MGAKKICNRHVRWSFIVVVVLCVGLGLAAWLTRHQPLARIPMADGTELRLEYVTFGTVHRVPGANRWIVQGADLARQWMRWKIPRQAAAYQYESTQPALVVWFTHYDPRTRKFIPGLSDWLKVSPVADGNGFQPTVESTESRGQFATGEENVPPMPHKAVRIEIFDRRNPKIRLNLSGNGLSTEISVPNQVAETQFPQWQPETLPQTRRVDEVDIVLRRISRKTDATGKVEIVPEFEAYRDGEKVSGVIISVTTVGDATGNSRAGYEKVPLPFSERAWYVQARVLRESSFPFALTDGFFGGPVPMPAAGQSVDIPLSEGVKSLEAQRATLYGPGRYDYQGKTLVFVGKALEGEEAINFMVHRNREAMRLNSSRPFVILGMSRPEREGTMYLLRLIRLQWNGQGHQLKYFFWTKLPEPFTDETDPKKALMGEHYVFPLPDNEIQFPAPGTPVTLQVIPDKEEFIEFMVAPPRVGQPD